jgi:hypothetical protein
MLLLQENMVKLHKKDSGQKRLLDVTGKKLLNSRYNLLVLEKQLDNV